MTASSSTNRFEDNVVALARDDTNVYDYYIKANGGIVRLDSVESIFVETLSDLNDCFNITTQSNNLLNLLNRVRSLNEDESNYNLDHRTRLCDYVWNKFQRTIDIEKDILQKKEYEIALQKAPIRDLLNSVLSREPTAFVRLDFQALIDRNNRLNTAIEAEIEAFRRGMLSRSNESCSEAARRWK
ncbi:MAG: hypothetical protein K1060chlam4_01218 [Candidatus Anoxychlamydiales bacterium]|nr:hypothetical protein [Candidatus Anoxychlamydiales bacterium]